MSFLKILLLLAFSFVSLSASVAQAQTNQPTKISVDEVKNRKWEYCVIYRQFNGQTKDKKITGIVTITYLETTGERDENVEVELTPQNPRDTSTYHLSITKALAKAFAQLGNEGWEFVGKFPYAPFFNETQPGFIFKRPKQ